MRYIISATVILESLLASPREQLRRADFGTSAQAARVLRASPDTMTSYDFVLGTWHCDGRTPDGKIDYTFTQENSKVMDGTWFKFQAVSPAGSHEAFMTYDSKARLWRYISIDRAGGYSIGTAPSWTGNSQTWTGYSYSNGIRRSWGRIVLTKVSDREKREDFYKASAKGKFQSQGSEICRKTD